MENTPAQKNNWISVFPASHHLLTTGTSKKLSQLDRDHPKWPQPRHSVLAEPLPVMNRTHIHPPLSMIYTGMVCKVLHGSSPGALLCCRRKTCTGGLSRVRSNSTLKSYSQGHGRRKDHHQNQTSIIHRQIIQFVVYAAGSEVFELFSSDLIWVQNRKVLSVPH